MTKKLILMIALALFSVSTSYAVVESVFNDGASGTTSATVFVPAGNGVAEVRDLAWRLDSGVTTGFISQHVGQRKYAITSSTASSASVLWITNSDTGVANGEFIIFLDESAGDYYLRRVSAATTTSITISASIAITTTTSDVLWSTLAFVEKPVASTVSLTGAPASLWFPALVPSALVIDGNTTACRISINGVRGNRDP